MRAIKETCPWPHPRVCPRIRNILPRYESYQSSCRTTLSLRRAAPRNVRLVSSSLSFSFFSRSPYGVLALSLFPYPPFSSTTSSSSVCPSPVRRITCYADTSHYYSQGRTSRPTDVCKSRVMQYASSREFEIDTHNQSAIDRGALAPCPSRRISRERSTHNEISARCILTTRYKSLKIEEIHENIY